MYPDLNGKTAVVTGASVGLGHGIARRFLQEGMSVVVNFHSDKHRGEAQKLADEFNAPGETARVVLVQADISQEDGAPKLRDEMCIRDRNGIVKDGFRNAVAAIVVHFHIVAICYIALASIDGIHFDSRLGVELAQVLVVRPHGMHAESWTFAQKNELVFIPGRTSLVRLSRIEIPRQVFAFNIEFLPHIKLNGRILYIDCLLYTSRCV